MLKFRNARMADADLLLEWRNDPLTREMSRNTDLVSRDDHIAWLNRQLAKIPPMLFIVELDELPVATFRIDGDEISYTVAPSHRGKGLATALLKQVHNLYGPLKAKIFQRNVQSVRAARRAGIRVVFIDNE